MLTPPSSLPVHIVPHFKLLKLLAIDARTQKFSADLFLEFEWLDPRLAYKAPSEDSTDYYLDDAVDPKLAQIWHLQVDFMNATSINYRNKALFIYPNGCVKYLVRIIGEFEYNPHLQNFPFDSQTLSVRMSSFLKDNSIFIFVPPPSSTTFPNYLPDKNSRYQEESIRGVTTTIQSEPWISIKNLSTQDERSVYTINIATKRDYTFYVYQVLVPLFMLLLLNCTIFYTYKEPILDRIMISLTNFLVLVAIKFTINLDLPQVGYLMAIDKIFFISYFILFLMVFANAFHYIIKDKDQQKALAVEVHSKWLIPLIFFLMLILFLLI